MKTRLLWTLILSVGSTALYFGLVRPDVSTVPKRIRDFVDRDPATQPPIQLPPLVVSESRLPAIPLEPTDPSPRSQDVPIQDQTTIDSAPEAPVVVSGKDTAEVTREAKIEIKK
jgi:hypothetical protein